MMRKECIAITFLLVSSFVFISCEDKNKEVLKEKTQNERVNEWVYSEMNNQYLYYKDMPASTRLDYSIDPKDFFASLLSRQQEMKVDGNNREYFYSYMETPENTKSVFSSDLTYGLDFVRYPNPQISGSEIARILYVLKDSPAERAGIKRGDFIYKVNNELLNATNYALLKSGQAINVYKAAFVVNSEGKTQYVQYSAPVNIAAAQGMDENPIHYSNVLEYDGRKIGYIVYNTFKFGPTDDPVDFRYENELRDLMKSFKNQGVTDLILDLRYNGGGYLRTAQLLASTIVPSSGLGQLMAIQEMNDKMEKLNKEKETNFYPASNIGDANLNLNRLVVIGTRFTASASELIINCLRPYMSVIHVGEVTEGKNVGSYSIKNDKFPGYKLQPITIKIYNKLHESNYRDGFKPTDGYAYDEIGSARLLAPFGSIDDEYLKMSLKALGVILPVNQKISGRQIENYVLRSTGACEIHNPKGVIVL
ncbi:MAG: S41 family peptidase [Bacteroidales bacterium]